MIFLENWHYQVEMGCLQDKWKLSGNAYNHPRFTEGKFVYTSTPVFLDRENRIVRTYSGSEYKLGTCDGDEDKQFGYILDDIKNEGTCVF